MQRSGSPSHKSEPPFCIPALESRMPEILNYVLARLISKSLASRTERIRAFA
jgi:hypothetical protein